MTHLSEAEKQTSRNYTLIILFIIASYNLISDFTVIKMLVEFIGVLISYISMRFTTKNTEAILSSAAEKQNGEKTVYYILLGILCLFSPTIIYSIASVILLGSCFVGITAFGLNPTDSQTISIAVLAITLFIICAIIIVCVLWICLTVPYIRALTVE